MILKTLGKPGTLLKHVTDRPGHDRRYAIDDSKIRAHTGWRPERDFDSAAVETVEWYRRTASWWEPIKSGEFWDYYRANYGL